MNRYTNPFNYINYIITGTEHGGPFNSVSPTPPSDPRDRIFWEHDRAYGQLGPSAYFTYNQADEDLLRELPKHPHPQNFLALNYFRAKKQMSGGMRGFYSGTTFSPTPLKRQRLEYYSPSPAYAQRDALLHGTASAQRFRAQKTQLPTKNASSKWGKSKLKRVPYNPNLNKWIRQHQPIVDWTMVGPAAPDVVGSSTGVQGVRSSTSLGLYDNLFMRDDLQKIYHKLWTDIRHGPASQAHDAYNNISSFQPTLKCHGYERELTLLNTGTTICYIEFWEFYCKTDQNPALGNDWSAALTAAVAGGAKNNYGLHQTKSNTVIPTIETTYNITDPGARPDKSLIEFWNEYTLLRKHKVRLEPLASTKLKLKYPGFAVSQRKLFDTPAAATLPALERLTVSLLTFLIGEKCYDDTAGNQQTSYMPANVTINYVDRGFWSIEDFAPTRFKFKTNTPQAFGDATVAEDHFIAANPVVAMPSYIVPQPDIGRVEEEVVT